MRVYFPHNAINSETRITLIPSDSKRLASGGLEILIDRGFGDSLGYSDEDYKSVGAHISSDPSKSLADSQVVIRLNKPNTDEIAAMKPGCIHISFLDPFNEKDLVERLTKQKISAISLEMIPRTTIAQKMDVLSSQANLAGYVSVLIAARELIQILPMMMTPAGTIKPSRVFVIGVGVAGLQAIATAKRLGARVDAFDTRPVVEEQVKSLGAKFVKVELGETGQTKDGYAKALTEEQLQLQREAMAKQCAISDVVITTAQIFGRKAPVIVTQPMLAKMRKGSVAIDLAVESGGNIEGSELGKIVDIGGVKVVGLTNLPGKVPLHASQMLSANLTNLLLHLLNKESKIIELNLEDEVVKSALITHGGAVVNERLKPSPGKGT